MAAQSAPTARERHRGLLLAVMADVGGEGRPLAEGCKIPLTLMPMTGAGPQIVIKGRREDWPGGARTLTPREPGREPNRQTFWFGAELDPDGSQVWFRITSEAVRRMREGDAVGRGERLVDALLAWLTPARRLGPEVNRFQVLVSDDGDIRLRLNGGTMELIPHHQDDKHGTREYRSPDGAWRVVRTRRPGGSRNARPRWEVHERYEGRGAGWRHHAAFERRRDALVFLDTTTAASGGESVTTAPARRRETPEPSQEPPQSSPRRTPKGPITHDLDETRSQDIPWSLCGVLLYDPRQIAKEGEPATCGKCQRFRSAASYRKRQAAMKAAKKET